MGETSVDFIWVLLALTILLNVLILMAGLWNNPQGKLTNILSQCQDIAHLIREESRNNRNELSSILQNQQDQLSGRMDDLRQNQSYLLGTFQKQVHQLTLSNDVRFKNLNESTQRSLSELQKEISVILNGIREDNSAQLEKMRVTVDEKLHQTLENRLGHSFKLVSDSLDKVQKGLGEMQALANGVGDLKRVLSNVKTRGIMGEIQLASILEQMLSPEQYALNVATIPSSRNHVEFAIKFPGRDKDRGHIWLPIDSKFPLDRHEAVIMAHDAGDKVRLAQANRDLISTVKSMAKEIRDKYISPPYTTDFGILFLPTEGLYAEVIRHPGLMEEMQRDYRIMLAGPTNLAAFLNSIQLGFQSLAIEKRSSEVWKILGAVKSEFGRFGEILNKTQKKLQEASAVIDKAGVRTRAIERQLRSVEELPAAQDH